MGETDEQISKIITNPDMCYKGNNEGAERGDKREVSALDTVVNYGMIAPTFWPNVQRKVHIALGKLGRDMRRRFQVYRDAFSVAEQCC